MRRVRDDPQQPDPGFAELYAGLPEAESAEPWLGWAQAAGGPVLYLGIGAGRVAAPLLRAGVELVGVDSHPGMLELAAARLPGVELLRARIEELDLGRRFALVMAPSNILFDTARLAGAARHSWARVGLELINPHWLGAGAGSGVKVLRLDRERAELEVSYPGGFVQVTGPIPLVWPEAVEGFLAEAGLRLERLQGEPGRELAECPTFYVLAKRLRSAQIPST